MYRQIMDDLLGQLKSHDDYRYMERRLNIGGAFRHIKKEKQVPTGEVVTATGINRNSINTLMQMEEVNTTSERFQKILDGLNVSSDEFIRIARETARYNFYQLGQKKVPVFKYRTHEVEIYSPPSFNCKDFMWCLVRIHPGKQINDLEHSTMDQVAGFVMHGHLGIHYGEREHIVHTNQSFFFDPKIKHAFKNQSPSGTTELYLMYRLKAEPSQAEEKRGRKPGKHLISAPALIKQIRKELSADPNRMLPLSALANLSRIRKDALAHLSYRPTKIIPFEKIDLLANLTDDPFECIIQKSEDRYQGWIRIFTDQDKATVDLSLRHGIHFTSQTGIGMGKRNYSICDATLESWKSGDKRKEWRYQGTGFMGIIVQRGILGVQYGNQPQQILKWGDSLYLNSDIPVTFLNAVSEEKAKAEGENPEAKALLIASPPIF